MPTNVEKYSSKILVLLKLYSRFLGLLELTVVSQYSLSRPLVLLDTTVNSWEMKGMHHK